MVVGRRGRPSPVTSAKSNRVSYINEFPFDLDGYLMMMTMTCSEQPNACDCFPWWEDDRRRMRCVVLMNMAVVGSVNGSGSAKCESWKYEVRGLHCSHLLRGGEVKE